MENKNFDVLISPTDVLKEELQEVLGGSKQSDGQDTDLCIIFCNEQCKRVECNCNAKGQYAETPEDCPPGYTVIDNKCIELD